MTSELKALKQAHKIHRPACPSALSSFKDATTETRNLEADTNTPFYLSLRACSRAIRYLFHTSDADMSIYHLGKLWGCETAQHGLKQRTLFFLPTTPQRSSLPHKV